MEHRPRRFSHLLALPLLLVLGALASSLLPGCQTTGGGTAPTALQTFDGLYSSALQAETIALQGTAAALTAKAITVTAAKKVEASLDATKAVLDAAHAAMLAGNTGLATANLSTAVGSIATLSACLTTKPLTPTTFDACLARYSLPQVSK